MIYHVFANRSNAGDWLSARGIQSLLAPLEVTEYLCDEPFIEEAIAALAAATSRRSGSSSPRSPRGSRSPSGASD
jgi:hypothetical protein